MGRGQGKEVFVETITLLMLPVRDTVKASIILILVLFIPIDG
jgi:hypothetical protein